MAYIEPAPIKDKENPLESMMERFNIAAEKLGLSDEVYKRFKKILPSRSSSPYQLQWIMEKSKYLKGFV